MNRLPRRAILAWGIGRQLLRGIDLGWVLWVGPTLFVCGSLGWYGALGWVGIPLLPLLSLLALWGLSSRITAYDRQNVEPLLRRLPIPADDVFSIRIVIRLAFGAFFVLFSWLAIALGGHWGSSESGPGLSFQVLCSSVALCWIGILAIEASPTRPKTKYDSGRVAFLLVLHLGIVAIGYLLLTEPIREMAGGRLLGLHFLAWTGACVLLGLSYWLAREDHRRSYFGLRPEQPLKWFEDPPWFLVCVSLFALIEPWGCYYFGALLLTVWEAAWHLWSVGSRWRNPGDLPRPTLAEWLSLKFVLATTFGIALYWRGATSEATESTEPKSIGLEGLDSIFEIRLFVFFILAAFPITWLATRPSRWQAQDRLLVRLPVVQKDVRWFRARETVRFFSSFALTLVAAELALSVLSAPVASEVLATPWTRALGWVVGVGLWTEGAVFLFEGRLRWWLLAMGPLVAWGVLALLPWAAGQSAWVAGLFLLLVGLWAVCLMVNHCGEPAWPPPPRG